MKKIKTTKNLKWRNSTAFFLFFLIMTALSVLKLNASITQEKYVEPVEKEMIEVVPVREEPVQQEPIRQVTRDSVKVKEKRAPHN